MIRQANAEDAAALAAIWTPIIRDTLITFNPVQKTPGEIAETIAQKTAQDLPFLVAEDGGRVLGFATYGPFRAGAGYAHTMEHTIILAPEARGRGLGRALLAALERYGAARGVHVLVAGVSAANPAGVAFHAAAGYVEVGRMPQVGFKQDQWLDLVLMQKLLT